MPVVAVTAGLTEGMEPQLLKIGFDAVLSKPVTNQTLQELCARFCQPHVLLIEDDQDSGELLSLLLSTKNVRCTHVTTGKQAFDVIESTHITHVISDLNLPDCNGLSLVGELVKRNNTLTAYLVSGNQLHPKDIPRNLVKGAFVKPINDADINKILAKESNYQTG